MDLQLAIEKLRTGIKFLIKKHRLPNIEHPKSYSEKLQWLKLYYHDPASVEWVDKIRVKPFIDRIVGPGHTIPTLAIYKRPDEIPWEKLPETFVLKTTHDSGGVAICRDPKTFSRAKAEAKLRRHFNKDYSKKVQEWPYGKVPRRIILEPLMVEEDPSKAVKDYKFYCFDGRAEYVLICTDRERKGHLKYHYYDREGRLHPFSTYSKGLPADHRAAFPDNIGEMFDMAEKIAGSIPAHPHLRIDLYSIGGKIYFSEITLYDSSGMDRHMTREGDRVLGELLHLPCSRMR
ncbi:MAG: glycosyl transferase [Bacteroidales bacterium]|nr:glycosyl transferase [Bacteroidales bacterium]